MIDLLITGANVITVDPERRVFSDGGIAINDGKIIGVGPTAELAGRFAARETIEGTGMIAMPGLINCHMHLPQVMMRGVIDNVEVMDKLKNYIWPIQGSYDEGDALTSARLGLLEMIKAGTTAFLSTGMHPRYGIDAIAKAIVDSGIRGVISKYIMDSTGYAEEKTALDSGMWENASDSLRQAEELIEHWHGAGNGRLQVWYSPRSVGAVSRQLFEQISQLAVEHGVGITTHWAEVQSNADYTMGLYGLLPVEYAAEVGMLGRHVTFAHGIYFTEKEIDLLAETGTNICHCPVCNSKLVMGTARVSEMLQKGVNVCLGNDGMPVNNTADMFREMRTSLLLQRDKYKNPLYPTAAEAIEMATINGARGIFADHLVGSLEQGKRADVILIRAKNPHMVPLHDPVSAVVWAANGNDVDTVVIDGNIVMRKRQVLTMDEEKILEDAQSARKKILEQSGVRASHVWQID